MATEKTSAQPGPDRARQREELLAKHRAARAKREAAALTSREYQAAAEEIARIEVQINRLEEPA